MKLVKLPPDGSRENCIDLLKDALEAAERGEVLNVFFVIEDDNRQLRTGWSGCKDIPSIIGRMRIIEHDILSEG